MDLIKESPNETSDTGNYIPDDPLSGYPGDGD